MSHTDAEAGKSSRFLNASRAETVTQSGFKNSIYPQTSTALTKSDKVAHDTPFLIRNRAGHDIIITPLGDKRGEKITISNNSQEYIHFLVKDEFSSLTAYSREVEVIIDCPIVQEKPITFSMSKLLQNR